MVSVFDTYAQSPADFSGNWTLNTTKSNPPINELKSTMTITQKDNEITMDVTILPPGREPLKRTEKITFGNSLVSKSNNNIRTVYSSWASDKQSFSTTETIIFNENGTKKEFKRTTVYSLSDQGKALILETNDTVPEGSSTLGNQRHETRIYDKS